MRKGLHDLFVYSWSQVFTAYSNSGGDVIYNALPRPYTCRYVRVYAVSKSLPEKGYLMRMEVYSDSPLERKLIVSVFPVSTLLEIREIFGNFGVCPGNFREMK